MRPLPAGQSTYETQRIVAGREDLDRRGGQARGETHTGSAASAPNSMTPTNRPHGRRYPGVNRRFVGPKTAATAALAGHLINPTAIDRARPISDAPSGLYSTPRDHRRTGNQTITVAGSPNQKAGPLMAIPTLSGPARHQLPRSGEMASKEATSHRSGQATMGTHSSHRRHGAIGSLALTYPQHAESDHRHRAGHEGSVPVTAFLPGGTITSKSRFERLTGVADAATTVLFHRKRDLAYPETS